MLHLYTKLHLLMIIIPQVSNGGQTATSVHETGSKGPSTLVLIGVSTLHVFQNFENLTSKNVGSIYVNTTSLLQ